MTVTSDYLSISDFASIANVSRKTLIYYDKIGLLCPDYVSDNGYRYYSRRQIDTAMVINVFAELGVSLESIRSYLKSFDSLGPANAISVFEDQCAELERQIHHYDSLKEVASLRLSLFKEGVDALSKIKDTSSTTYSEPKLVEKSSDSPLFLSEKVCCTRPDASDTVITDFYDRRLASSVPLGCPGGFIVSKDSLLSNDASLVSHFYFLLEGEGLTGGVMPAGHYLVLYMKESYGAIDAAYATLFDYIQDKNLEICGNAYEECLLDGLTSSDSQNYLTRISIKVKPSNFGQFDFSTIELASEL